MKTEMMEMEDVNLLLLNKREIEEAIGDTIAVIYRIQSNESYADNTRTAIKCDNHTKIYKLYRYNNYLVVSSKNFYSIIDGKLELIHCYE